MVVGKVRPRLDGADPINRGLLGFWPMVDGGGEKCIDISPYRNDMRMANGPLWSVGALGKSLKFDGTNDYLSSTKGQSLTAFSAVSWVNLGAGAAYGHSILSSLFGSDQTILWTSENYGTQFKFWATTSAMNATSAVIPHIRERWVCAGVSWAPGRTTRFYLNGANIGDGTTAGDIQSPTTGWNIGRYAVPNLWFFPGSIQYTRIWGRVLLPGEFSRLYNDPLAGVYNVMLPNMSRILGPIVPIPPIGAAGGGNSTIWIM